MADMDPADPRPAGADAEPSSRPNVLAQLWQRRGVFTVTFATAFVLVVCLLFVLPVGYVASGSVIVGDREPLMGSSSAAWVQKIGDPADMESNILLIQAADAETQIAARVRELDIKRGTFVDMSQRLSQLETERRIIEPSTQLVSLAELPTRPAFPQRTPFLVGGLALASVLATAAGLLTAHDGTARVGEQL